MNLLHWGKQTKATHLYISLCLQQNLQQGNLSRNDSSLKSVAGMVHYLPPPKELEGYVFTQV